MQIQSSALVALGAVSLVITLKALAKSKNNQFYSDTFHLLPLGIFVWGDGLVLGPFWVVSVLLWWLLELPLIWIGRYYLLFWIVRSLYEVMYWLIHQSADANYTPPIGRNTKWLERNEVRILYQVFHTGVVIMALFLLMYSFGFGGG